MIGFYIVLFVSQFFWSGFVILKLWTWFMVPLGLPSITLAHAIGLDALFAAFKGMPSASNDKSEEAIDNASARIVANAFWMLIALVVGYLAHLFI